MISCMSKHFWLLIVAGLVALCLFCDDVAHGLGISLTATRWTLGTATLLVVAGIPLLTPEPFLTRLQQEGNRRACLGARWRRCQVD